MTGSAFHHGLHNQAFSDAREEGGYLRSAGRTKGGGPNQAELLLLLVTSTPVASTIPTSEAPALQQLAPMLLLLPLLLV